MCKYPCVLLLLVLVAAGCGHQQTTANTSSFDGVYNMVPEGGQGDTAYLQKKQLKMYTDGYVMYVGINPADSAGSFGVGTFSFDSGRLTENMIYGAADSVANTKTFSTTTTITQNGKGYTQAAGSTEKKGLAEKYEPLAESAGPSVLDGAWKQVSGYSFKDRDTIFWNDAQYKVFYKGNFVYGNYAGVSGTANRKRTYTSWGSFSISGDTLMKETVTASNVGVLNGKSFDIHITINGENNYSETHQGAGGQTEVITYQRMKR